jgi:iron donor protein CyaY
MEDKDFQRKSDQALDDLNRKLTTAGDRYDFESDFNAGALTIEFDEPPARFVVSPNSPVRQIWVSALTRSFKLDWNEARGAFVLANTGQTLTELIQSAIGTHMGEEVTL